MRGVLRFVAETLLLMVLAGALLIGAWGIIQWIFPDVESRYFTMGFYVATHLDLVRWIWKHLGIEKKIEEDPE